LKERKSFRIPFAVCLFTHYSLNFLWLYNTDRDSFWAFCSRNKCVHGVINFFENVFFPFSPARRAWRNLPIDKDAIRLGPEQVKTFWTKILGAAFDVNFDPTVFGELRFIFQ